MDDALSLFCASFFCLGVAGLTGSLLLSSSLAGPTLRLRRLYRCGVLIVASIAVLNVVCSVSTSAANGGLRG